MRGRGDLVGSNSRQEPGGESCSAFSVITSSGFSQTKLAVFSSYGIRLCHCETGVQPDVAHW